MEEDIKKLEEKIDYFKCNPEGCNWRLSFEDEKDIQAIENLLKGYRKLERTVKIKNGDIEWMQNKINKHFMDDVTLQRDYILKSKVKEIRDKAEVMDYYCLSDVIEDLNKLLGDEE